MLAAAMTRARSFMRAPQRSQLSPRLKLTALVIDHRSIEDAAEVETPSRNTLW
jgi:hypothetical protein